MDSATGPQRGDFFFAYGTLRPGGRMFQELRLGGALGPFGPGAMRGTLVSLGPYPGMIRDGRGRVRGTLYCVRDPAVFARLDDYEGFDPARPEGSLYLRALVPLAGRRGRAWVYVWNGTARGRPVPGGVWRG